MFAPAGLTLGTCPSPSSSNLTALSQCTLGCPSGSLRASAVATCERRYNSAFRQAIPSLSSNVVQMSMNAAGDLFVCDSSFIIRVVKAASLASGGAPDRSVSSSGCQSLFFHEPTGQLWVLTSGQLLQYTWSAADAGLTLTAAPPLSSSSMQFRSMIVSATLPYQVTAVENNRLVRVSAGGFITALTPTASSGLTSPWGLAKTSTGARNNDNHSNAGCDARRCTDRQRLGRKDEPIEPTH